MTEIEPKDLKVLPIVVQIPNPLRCCICSADGYVIDLKTNEPLCLKCLKINEQIYIDNRKMNNVGKYGGNYKEI
jgi:hypothetical protein